MGDADLDAIRAKRMAQLQAQYGMGTGENSAEKQKAAQEREAQINDTKNVILSQVLDQGARARLNTIMVAKPEKGRQIEGLIVSMAQQGRLPGKISEPELVNMLEQINSSTARTTSVKFDRRRAALDDSDDDF